MAAGGPLIPLVSVGVWFDDAVMPATPRPRVRPRTEYSPGRILPALEDVDRLTAWAAPQFQRSRSRLVGPRTSPESLPPLQFPDLATLPAIFAVSVPVRPRQRGAQSPPFVLDDLWTGFVLWLAQDVQPQRRRAAVRPDSGSTLWPGVVADDVVTMGAWVTPPWPVRQTRQPARTQQGEPPAAALVDLPAWPVLDSGATVLSLRPRRGRTTDSPAPFLPPDADAVLWLVWNVQSFTPTPRPRRGGTGDTFRSTWFDTLIVDILLPRSQEAAVRRPAPRTARGASELPVVVQTDAAPYTALFVQQPRPRMARPLVRAQAEDVTAIIMGAAPPAVGGPYTVLVGQLFSAGPVAGTLQVE